MTQTLHHPGGDWFLQDWLRHFGKRQASLVNELGWTKGRANMVWHGQQPYRREVVNEIATWLGIEPYELLLSPAEAMALRRIREMAAEIVMSDGPPIKPSKPSGVRLVRKR